MLNFRISRVSSLPFQILLQKKGANVISIHHERGGEGTDVNGCYLRVVLETRDFAQIKEIRDALIDAGFKLV